MQRKADKGEGGFDCMQTSTFTVGLPTSDFQLTPPSGSQMSIHKVPSISMKFGM